MKKKWHKTSNKDRFLFFKRVWDGTILCWDSQLKYNLNVEYRLSEATWVCSLIIKMLYLRTRHRLLGGLTFKDVDQGYPTGGPQATRSPWKHYRESRDCYENVIHFIKITVVNRETSFSLMLCETEIIIISKWLCGHLQNFPKHAMQFCNNNKKIVDLDVTCHLTHRYSCCSDILWSQMLQMLVD